MPHEKDTCGPALAWLVIDLAMPPLKHGFVGFKRFLLNLMSWNNAVSVS